MSQKYRNQSLSGPSILINASNGSSLVNFRGPLIVELKRRGYNVVVTAPEIGSKLANEIKMLGAKPLTVPLRRAGLNFFGDIWYALKLFRIIRAVKPLLVLGYTIKPNIWGTVASHLAGVPSAALVTGLGYTFISGPGWKRQITQKLAQLLYRFSLKHSQCVVFQNPDDLDDFVAAGCLTDSSKARLVNGSGVDLSHYRSEPLPAQPVFLIIARLLAAKGIREFVAASKAVRKAIPSARFIVVGPLDDGPDGLKLNEISGWPSDLIEYAGEIDDVRPFIARSSIYVLPSYREGTPRSVLEAMAMGRPIITTDTPGCRQTVSDGKTGYLVPVGQVPQLATAMLRLGLDSNLRQSMGDASKERATELFSVDFVNATLLGHLNLPPLPEGIGVYV